jgi:ABC-type sugar transport system permease subunit
MAWLYIYNPNSGVLNYLIQVFGGSPQNWLLDIKRALWCIIAMGIWSTMGYNMIVFTAGLQGIPEHLYEAARIDGAGVWKQFIHITLPMLAPTTFFLFVMSVIGSFQVFGQVYTMTNGGPMNATTTIVHQIYQNGFEGYKMGYASAQAVFLLFITTTVTLLTFKYGDSGKDRELA